MASLRSLRILLVATLAVLTVQGLTGDFVNLFAAVPSGNVGYSLGGITAALFDSGYITVYHALAGALLFVLALVVVGLSLKSHAKPLLILSVLAGAAVTSALVGGLAFVLSTFQNNANSAQMGGSFIGAYALYFIELYFAKQP